MLSLVGLRAVDIVKALREGSVEIGSYGKPICTVVPVVETPEDLVDLFYFMSRKLNCNDYLIIERPRNRTELVSTYRELEKELSNESETD